MLPTETVEKAQGCIFITGNIVNEFLVYHPFVICAEENGKDVISIAGINGVDETATVQYLFLSGAMCQND
jgi:hypothetical protein